MDKQPKFKKGDKVRNLTNGKIMTILTHNALKHIAKKGIEETFTGTYWCSWTDSKGKELDESGIPEEVLVLA
jgi:hypothetical protein